MSMPTAMTGIVMITKTFLPPSLSSPETDLRSVIHPTALPSVICKYSFVSPSDVFRRRCRFVFFVIASDGRKLERPHKNLRRKRRCALRPNRTMKRPFFSSSSATPLHSLRPLITGLPPRVRRAGGGSLSVPRVLVWHVLRRHLTRRPLDRPLSREKALPSPLPSPPHFAI